MTTIDKIGIRRLLLIFRRKLLDLSEPGTLQQFILNCCTRYNIRISFYDKVTDVHIVSMLVTSTAEPSETLDIEWKTDDDRDLS